MKTNGTLVIGIVIFLQLMLFFCCYLIARNFDKPVLVNRDEQHPARYCISDNPPATDIPIDIHQAVAYSTCDHDIVVHDMCNEPDLVK
jgi:hypothetical protein